MVGDEEKNYIIYNPFTINFSCHIISHDLFRTQKNGLKKLLNKLLLKDLQILAQHIQKPKLIKIQY